MSSLSPSTRKLIGPGVRNFDSGVGDREKRNAVSSGTYAKSAQNPAIKKTISSSANKLLAKSSPLDRVWDIGLRVYVPGPTTLARGEENFLGEAISAFAKPFPAMRPGRRTRPPLVGTAPALRTQEPINLVRAAARPLTSVSVRKASNSAFPTYFSDSLAN